MLSVSWIDLLNVNDGESGVGILDTVVEYAVSNSGTIIPGSFITDDEGHMLLDDEENSLFSGIWSTEIPITQPGEWLWTRTTQYYTDGTTTVSYNVSRNGENPYTIILSNENHSFPASWDSAIESSTVCNVYVYQGGNKVPATIGNITGIPTGMTVNIQNNGTLNTRFRINVTPQMIERNGTLSIPINVGDLTFEKLFTYSLAFNGAPGNGIDNITEMYATSTSLSDMPEDNEFTTSIPSLDSTNRCLWNYEIVDYSDGSVVATEKHVIGMYSEDGRSIESVKNYYLASTQSTGITRDTTGWTEIPQPISENLKYLWNYETITYSTGEYDSTEPIIIGVHGDSAITYFMQISHAAVVLDNTGNYNPRSITVSAKYQQGANTLLDYYGRFKIETSSDNSSWAEKYVSSSNEATYTYIVPNGVKSIRVALYMAEGTTTLLDQQTIPIITDGIGISSVVEYYAVNNSSSAVPPNSSFDTTIPTMDETNKYLWNFEEVTYTDSHVERTDKVVIGVFGTDGSEGRGITSITECYLATSADSGITTSTSGWTTTIQTITPENKYLWNYEIINYTDGQSTTTTPVIIGTYGEQGDDAYTVILSNESHTFSGGTSSAVAGSVTCNVIGYKGATQEEVIIGEITGCPTGMTVTISNNNSTSASFTVNVTTSMSTRNGVLNIPVTIDGHNINKQFSYSLAIKGDKGDPATNYSLSISHAAIVLQDTGTFNPGSILLHAKSQRGDGQISDYSGRFKVETTINNSTWIAGYSSESDESSYSFHIPTGTKSIKCSLYLAGGMTTLIDQQVIPVLSDGIGIVSVEEYYAVNQSSSSAPKDSDFSTGSSIPSMTATNRFLWNYELVTYTDGSTVKTDKVVIGVWGEQGNSGKGISAIVEYYLASPESTGITTSTSGWTTTIQTVTNTNKYLWNYEVIEYTDGESTTTTPVIIGAYGDRGDDGTDGYTIVLSNESHTFSGNSSSALVANTTCNVIGYKGTAQQSVTIGTITGCPVGMTTTILNNGSTNALFRVNVTTEMTSRSGVLTVPCTIDGKTFNKQFSYSLTLAGESTTVYNLLVSSAVISRMQSGQYNPPTVTLQAYKQVGSGSMELYSGRFKIESTLDNEHWIENDLSEEDESSTEFVIPITDKEHQIMALRFSLYESGGTSQILDYQTVPIINDGTVGNGIKEYIVEYALSDSDTVIPGGPLTDGNNVISEDGDAFSNSAWSTELPQNIPDGLYLWTRVKFIFTDGEETVAYTISKSGENGKDGKDGKYIVKQIQQFYISTSDKELIGGTWSYVEPEELYSGEFLWKRFENVMSDASIFYSEAYCETIIGGVVSLVDEVEKSITNRVWQSDFINIINEYDGSTAKQIRDRVTEMEQNVDGIKTNISDISSTVRNKADGSEVTEIARQLQEVTDTASEHTRIISEDILGDKSSSIKSIAQQTANKFSWLVGNSGTGTSTTFTLTDRVAKLVADNINLYGMVTFNGLASDAQGKITDAQETADLANEKSDVGLGMKINHSSFQTENYGECYLHGYDEDGQPADIDGYIYWNKRKIIVNKTMIDPNIIPPYWTTVYLVLRLSSATASSGTLYMVWYDTGWKYAVTPTPNNIKGTWLWNEERDIVLGQFVETASEGKIVDAYLYIPPRNASTVRSGGESQYHDWIYNNGTDIITAKDIVDRWSTTAQDTTTTINGGLIETHTILSQALATNAIMSQNYRSGANDGEDTPEGNFSITGSYLDLETGNFFTPNFGIKGGNAYFNGDIHALSGELGGWVIDDEKIYYQSDIPGTSGSAFIKPSGSTSNIPIGGSETTGESWLMTVQDKFGVTTDGKLYCNDAIISGAINATSLTVSPGVTFPGVITSDNIVSNLIDVSEKEGNYINNKVDANWTKYNYSNATYMKANASVNQIYLTVPLKRCHFGNNDTIEISFDYIATTSATPNSYNLTVYIYYYGEDKQKLAATDSVVFSLDPSISTDKSVSKTLQLTNYPNTCVYYRLLFSVTSSSNLSRTLFRNIKGLWTSFSPVATSGNYSDLLDKPNLTIYIAKDGTVGEEPAEGSTGFKVSNAGLLTASNAVIYGTIFASGGEIGGCSISNGLLEVPAANITGTLTADKIVVGLGINLVEVDESRYTEYNQIIDSNWDVSFIEINNQQMGLILRPLSTSTFQATSGTVYSCIYLTNYKKYNGLNHELSVKFDYARHTFNKTSTIKSYSLELTIEIYDRDHTSLGQFNPNNNFQIGGSDPSAGFREIKDSTTINGSFSQAVYYRILLRVPENNINQLCNTGFRNIVVREKQNSDSISEIGSWTVSNSAIYRVSETWGNSAAGSAYIGVNGISITDKFKVDSNGILTCSGATINGKITAQNGSSIGSLKTRGSEFSDFCFYSGNRTNFNVDSEGICIESNGNFGASGRMVFWSRTGMTGDNKIQMLEWTNAAINNGAAGSSYQLRISVGTTTTNQVAKFVADCLTGNLTIAGILNANGITNTGLLNANSITNTGLLTTVGIANSGSYKYGNRTAYNTHGESGYIFDANGLGGGTGTAYGTNAGWWEIARSGYMKASGELVSEKRDSGNNIQGYVSVGQAHSNTITNNALCVWRSAEKFVVKWNGNSYFVRTGTYYSDGFANDCTGTVSINGGNPGTDSAYAFEIIRTINTTNTYRFYVTWAGHVYAVSTNHSSDERYKDIKGSIDHKDLFMSLNPIEFTWKNHLGINDNKHHLGIGAQTLKKLMEKYKCENLGLVSYDEKNDMYSVNYTELQMLTIPIVQDHEYRIRALEEENEKLRKQIQLLTKEGA